MSEYYSTNTKTIEDLNDANISAMYNQGYVFTRLGKGVMNQTRSLRIDLSKFELNSENRRILRKVDSLALTVNSLPLDDYSWEIHKLGKDFYTIKFGDLTMSASKIKEMFQEQDKSNMNKVFSYHLTVDSSQAIKNVGYCLAYISNEIVHYAYPFYDLSIPKELNLGLAMMTKAIVWAKENGKKYIYLGSVVDEKAKYKLQFEGLEWFEAGSWSRDIEKLKTLLTN